ncbi:hypothetical protein V7S76_05990 [Aquirufa sp. ROCK2-A2]
MEDKKYILSKNAIGIVLLWLGPPFFYFIRSQFHLGGGSVTSGIFYVLSLFLIRNPLNTQLGYKPNLHLLWFGGTYYLIGLFYFFVHNYNTASWVTDTINIITTLLFFILVLRVNNDVQKYLPFWIIVLTFILNIALIYSVITNPNYMIGQRATVQFGDEGFTGNPGTYARNGLFGIIISLLFLHKNEENLFKQNSFLPICISVLNLLLSLVTIIITQTRMILLSLIVILTIYVIFIRNKGVVVKEKKQYTRIIIGLIIGLIIYINYQYDLFSILGYYINNYWSMFQSALETGLSLGKNSSTAVDDSAMGRVENINKFKYIFNHEIYNLIFGKGFNYRYMDIPILEVLVNFGIVGLIFYILFILTSLYYTLNALKSNLVFQNFLGLTFIQVFIGMCTSGRPMDLAYCIMYIIYIRFLAVKPSSELNQSLN